jgi:hypothetical protein
MSKSAESKGIGTGVTDRRRFMAGVGLTTLGALGASKLGAVGESLTAAGDKVVTASDIDILNFALNLEYLEAEYYLRGAFGRGLANSDINGAGDLGGVTGGSPVPFQNDRQGRILRDYANEIALDEEAHVKFLRAALGSMAVARPTIDLQQSFTNAARAAGVIGPGQQFNPFADQVSFLIGAFIFEDVGVTAYKGAAALLNDKMVLEAAAGILAVEAYHAATIRTSLFEMGEYEAPRLISNLRDQADGAGDRDQPIRVQGQANIVPADNNGIAYSRSAAQVLNIVYLGGASANFGFFPDRLNGDIR